MRKSELKNKLFHITQEWTKAVSSGDVNKANELGMEKEFVGNEFTVARLELELFDAKDKLRNDPHNPTKKSIVETTDKDLREAQSKPLKRKPSEVDPTITIPGISSTRRTWTFRSSNPHPN